MSHTFNTESKLQGVGIGLRTPHLAELLDPSNALAKKVPWLEILTDNYLNVGGFYAAHLQALGERYPLTFHGVGLSIGSESPPNIEYLSALKALADKHQPVWISDHLSWSNHQDKRSHDLLPLPYTEENLKRICLQVSQAQNILERPLLLENISAYYEHPNNTLNEASFLNELCAETGCRTLLDANNLYVNHNNLAYDMDLYLNSLNFDYVQQLHLGGHEQRDSLLVDTHGASICDEVWDLYRKIIAQHGAIATLIEWDNNVPSLDILMSEKDKADSILLKETNKKNLKHKCLTAKHDRSVLWVGQ
tara:strand:+ start:5692 stop:6609 length:918 start_codon:yes stop_codon:yes gene_type:complete